MILCTFLVQFRATTQELDSYPVFKYSGGLNTEHVRISNGRACSVHGPDHSKTELQNGRYSLGRFIYKIYIYILYKMV